MDGTMKLPRQGLKRASNNLALENVAQNDEVDDENDPLKKRPARAKDIFDTDEPPRNADDDASKFLAAVKRGRGNIASSQSKLRQLKKHIGKKEIYGDIYDVCGPECYV